MYRIKQIEGRLKEIALSSSEFQNRLSDVVELVKNQLAWIGANSTFPANMPQKNAGSLKMEVAIFNFECKVVVKLNTAIDRTIEKCTEFYKGMCVVRNHCMILEGAQDQDFPAREEHLKNSQERLRKGEESISKIKDVSEEAIGIWIIQVSNHKHELEGLLSQNTPKVKEIESQLLKHEVTMHVLEPAEYRVMNEEAQAWSVFIKTPTGPT